MTIRQTFALDLRDDPALIAQYRAWHAPGAAPLAVLDAILATGVKVMEIYLTGNRLIMITETEKPSLEHGQQSSVSTSNDTEAWESLMWTFQKPLPWCRPSEKWVEAECIFCLPSPTPSMPAPPEIDST